MQFARTYIWTCAPVYALVQCVVCKQGMWKTIFLCGCQKCSLVAVRKCNRPECTKNPSTQNGIQLQSSSIWTSSWLYNSLNTLIPIKHKRSIEKWRKIMLTTVVADSYLVRQPPQCVSQTDRPNRFTVSLRQTKRICVDFIF